MRHRIPISKANLQWNYVSKKLSLVDNDFSPAFDNINIMEVEIVNDKISFKDLDAIVKLYDNVWGIKRESIYEFFKLYENLIPNVKIFERVDI